MIYFSFKHNKHLFASGLYALALSNIFHTRFVSVLTCLFSHTKFDSFVALRLLSYLNEFLCLKNIIRVVFNYILRVCLTDVNEARLQTVTI